jgi:hypothetical protein
MTKTEWYPGDTKPVRDGVYEREMETPYFAKFCEDVWYWGAHSIE